MKKRIQPGVREIQSIQIERRAVDQLIPFAGNARTHSPHQIDQIARSIAEFGFVNPILIGPDDVIVAGHARLMAARQLKMEHVPVIVLGHLNATQRRALVLADNQLSLNAGWDEETLRRELEALSHEEFPLELIGFDEADLEHLLADDGSPGLTDEDDVPDLPAQPISIIGDLWQLGEHRLLCGDARSTADVLRVMGEEHAHLVITDPPYNVGYTGNTSKHLTIAGDCMSRQEFEQLLSDAFSNYRQIVKPTASLYIWHASTRQRDFQNALEAAGFTVRCQLIWSKHTFAFGFGRYKYQHEPIYYCHVTGETDHWYGDDSQSTVWEANKPWGNREHPTAKPVALIERAILNSSRKQDLVADLFAGSGSTLIACEQQGRRCRAIEIEPRYVEVIVEPWQRHTGGTACLESDGRSFAEVKAEREAGISGGAR